MSTPAQIAANTANAQSSPGPTTAAGKAISSKNALTLGLFANADFIRPAEQSHYDDLDAALLHELAPVGVLETTLVDEIRRAMWRLHRCGQVEANFVIGLDDGSGFIFDPMETANTDIERVQKSVDRARSQAHRLLHKSTAELRKLQADRRAAVKTALTPVIPTEITSTKRTQSDPVAIPRNARCHCNFGLKYKRCCGRSAPPMLHAA